MGEGEGEGGSSSDDKVDESMMGNGRMHHGKGKGAGKGGVRAFRAVRAACRADKEKLCGAVHGLRSVRRCMHSHHDVLSDACKAAIQDMKGARHAMGEGQGEELDELGHRAEHLEQGLRGQRGHRGEYEEQGVHGQWGEHEEHGVRGQRGEREEHGARDHRVEPSKQQPQSQLPQESLSSVRVLASSAKPRADGHGSTDAVSIVVGACVACALLAAAAGVVVMRRRQLLTPVDGEGSLVAADQLAQIAEQRTGPIAV